MGSQNLRMYGLALLFLAIALSTLARALHVPDGLKTAMTVASTLCSLAAIVLSFKGAPPNRRPFVVVTFAVVALAAGLAIYFILPR